MLMTGAKLCGSVVSDVESHVVKRVVEKRGVDVGGEVDVHVNASSAQ